MGMSVRRALLAGLLVGALLAPAVPVRASATADLAAFVRKTRTMTFDDFKPLRGADVESGEWKALGDYGRSLSRCLIVDIPSMSSLVNSGEGGAPYSSALQCDGARTKMTQAALVAWAIATIAPLLPTMKMKKNPANKRSDRTSVVWTDESGLTIDFIAYGKGDAKKYPHASYVIDVEVLSPQSMATPSPTP